MNEGDEPPRLNLQSDAAWRFTSRETVEGFDEHVSRSVPLYRESHDLVLDLLPFFVSSGPARVLDIGCSTGTFLGELGHQFKNSEIQLHGIDIAENMVASANARFGTLATFHSVDFLDFSETAFDAITCFYTLQFVPPRARQAFVDKVFQDLHWGGGFFMFEKVRGSDGRFQDILTDSLISFKERKGLDREQIFLKSRSLRGVLEPFSSHGYHDLLTRSGFKDIEIVLRYGPFQGLLAIK